MKTVEVNGKEYKVIKKYKYFTLCEDEHGFKTCFNDFDLGLTPKYFVRDARLKLDKINEGKPKDDKLHLFRLKTS